VKAAWAGVALLAFGAVGDAIVDVTKKYQEDAQSQRILSAVIENNIKGHQKQKAAVEDSVAAWQSMSSVQDDKIRPAYSYLIRATQNITKSNKLMKIALDLAAGAHIEIGAAASALGRAYTGNLTALNKLVPGVKKLKDPLGEVERRFLGLAKIQADNDPFAQMTIVMDEFKEKLGKSFLPVMKSFAEYMKSPAFTKALDDIAMKVQKFGEWFMSKEGQETFKGWMRDLKLMLKLVGEFLDLVSQVSDLLGSSGKRQSKTGTGNLNATNTMTGTRIKAISPDNAKAWNGVAQSFGNVVMNVTINGVVSGNEVVTALTRYARGRGIPMSKLLK